ncbi:putative oxalocrotonate tautomerase [Hypoxylon trugodes]|uniref:putative oxalocrotonate tautomerase n=1 Tax=Hypoxylon trugodes TaxID=326681 RepID=UPI002194EC6C|nr:putative oxalocrotonate tautomerase [Hypoxylon trugodes]KAI1385717.1 putative oxalocrotonate tautomerase [Hypoxylon trugodes]
MPRWTFDITLGLLTADEKKTLATSITKIYTDLGFPQFWVNVFFHETKPENFYTGLESGNHAFFVINHAAKTFESEEQRLWFHDLVASTVKPIFDPKDIHWEYNIYQHPADNWRVQGMIPPVHNPDALKQWVEQNKTIPY